MSAVDSVRILISDFPQYVSAASVGDGFSTEHVFPYAPIAGLKIYLNGVILGSGYTENDDLGIVIFSAPPAPGVALNFSATTTLLTDAQISTLMGLYPDSDSIDKIKLVAADCLDVIASSQALIQKKIKMLDQETDGPALARALRDHAKELRKQVRDGSESGFEIIEMINNRPGYMEKMIKDLMRQDG